MFCPECGTQLEAFELFCHTCGRRMTEASHAAKQESAPVEQAAPLEAAPVQSKKKPRKKLIIGITAAVTALAVGIGAAAAYLFTHPKVYLRTKITEYDKDGEWERTVEYSYNDQGSPVEITIIKPDYDHEEVWDENLGFFVYQSNPNGGKQIRTITYEYNDKGHCVCYEQYYERFDKNGKLLEEKEYESTEKLGYRYNYNDDGTIDTIEQRELTGTSELGEYNWEIVYHYNDEGQLHEISTERKDGKHKNPNADFRYDNKGRLTASSTRYLEGLRLCQYEYDKNGNLEKVLFTRSDCSAPFDDEHITGMDKNEWPAGLGEPDYEAEFEYDGKGRLISRKVIDDEGKTESKVELEYDGKYLSRVEYSNENGQRVFEVTDDEDEATEIADSMGKKDLAMVRDKHGNIIKVINEDGSYAEYEYKSVRLSKKLAAQHNSIMYAIHRIDLMGGQMYTTMNYAGGNGLYSYVSFPTNELYEIEIILKASY